MNYETQRYGIWSGVLASVILFIALWPLLQFVPPPEPSSTAAEIAARYRENAFGILLGGTLMLASSALYVPFYAALSSALETIEGQGGTFARAQLPLGMMAVCIPVAITSVLWMLGAFRPERADDTIRLLNDTGWFLFFTPVVAGLVQALVIATVILKDRSEQPIFPRWAGYLNIWLGLAFMPGALLVFFKTGPFAWNGLLVFWLGVIAFAIWFITMTFLLLRTLDKSPTFPGSQPLPREAPK
jgi:hypothetical protein